MTICTGVAGHAGIEEVEGQESASNATDRTAPVDALDVNVTERSIAVVAGACLNKL